MPNELRTRSNFVSGVTTNNPLAIGDTTLNAANLANLQTIDTTNYAVIVLDPDGLNGAPEIVYVTAHTAAATSATIARGQEGSSARQHNLGTTWRHGPTAKDFSYFKTALRTSGNLTANGTSWANLDTGLDIVIAADANDALEINLNCVYSNEAVSCFLEVCSVVSGSPVNNFYATGTPNNAYNGVPGWGTQGSVYDGVGASFIYTVQAGDISGGTVTCRLRVKTGTATTKTIFAGGGNEFRWSVKNLGPTGR